MECFALKFELRVNCKSGPVGDLKNFPKFEFETHSPFHRATKQQFKSRAGMIIRHLTCSLNCLVSSSSGLSKLLVNPTLPLGIRTATKRAGGFKAGSNDSPGKRLGVKKHGGTFTLCSHSNYSRRMGSSREHNPTTKRNTMVARRKCIWPYLVQYRVYADTIDSYGKRFHYSGIRARLGKILQRPKR